MARVFEPIIGKEIYGHWTTDKITFPKESKDSCLIRMYYENIDGNDNVVPESVCSIDECLRQIRELRTKKKVVYD